MGWTAHSQENCKVNFTPSFDHEIIGFGEGSHGDATIYQVRLNFLKELEKISDTTQLLVEMPQGAGYFINDFLIGKIDSISFLKELKHFGLQTNSFLNFLKESNCNNVFGIDMQHHRASLKVLLDLLAKHFPENTLFFDRLRKALDVNFRGEIQRQNNKEEYINYLKANLDSLNKFVNEKRPILQQDVLYFMNIKYPLCIINQDFGYSILLQVDLRMAYEYRDSCMANNVILIEENTNGHIVVLASNTHVSKQKNRMGYYLEREYGKQYYSITTQFHRGQILMVKGEEDSYSVIQDKFESLKGSLPYKLNKLYSKEQFLIESSYILKKRILKRTWLLDIGAGEDPEDMYGSYVYGKVFDFFDAIYFVPVVDPSSWLLSKENINE